MLQDMHYRSSIAFEKHLSSTFSPFRNISQRLVLLRRWEFKFLQSQIALNNCRTEEAAKYLEQTKLQTSNGFTEEFSVMEDLMGLAIGWFFWTSTPVFIHPLALRCPWCEYSASEEDRRHHQCRADRGFLHLQGGLQQNLHPSTIPKWRWWERQRRQWPRPGLCWSIVRQPTRWWVKNSPFSTDFQPFWSNQCSSGLSLGPCEILI